MTALPSIPIVEITLAGLEFHVRVGILPHERELPQPLEIDVVVRCAGGNMLDYRDLQAAVSNVVNTGPLDYLETIATSAAERLSALPGVTWSRVTVRKPNVMLASPVAYVQVAVERGVA